MTDYYTSKGYYVIGEHIYAVEAFVKNHQDIIDKVMDWAKKEDVFVEFGCSREGQAYCRYHLSRTAETEDNKYKVIALEGGLYNLLKSKFPSMRKHILSLPTIIETSKSE